MCIQHSEQACIQNRDHVFVLSFTQVVPLSRRSGLLEWCEGTQPIGEYLVGQPGVKGSGAHSRYRPKDWSFLDCRRHMMVRVGVVVCPRGECRGSVVGECTD